MVRLTTRVETVSALAGPDEGKSWSKEPVYVIHCIIIAYCPAAA
jgi:hypothetical protein